MSLTTAHIIEESIWEINNWLPQISTQSKKLIIITDNLVKNLYGDALNKKLINHGLDCIILDFPTGENSKNYTTKQNLEEQLFHHKCGKDSLIIALGGGVVGDLAGFIAATYLRGIPYIQIPTTLLAMIDSSIGGKTGINTSYGKNLIGTIYPPLFTLLDKQLLTSLPRAQIVNGCIEAIKIFLTHDADGFKYMQKNHQKIIQQKKYAFIKKAAELKVTIINNDLYENNERLILNFGHTIGHAIEKMTNYTLLHGYAIGYGILLESSLSYLLGILSKAELDEVFNLLNLFEINPSFYKLFYFNPEDLIQAMFYDKKVRSQQIQCVLLQNIGKFYHHNGQYTHPISQQLVRQAIQFIEEH